MKRIHIFHHTSKEDLIKSMTAESFCDWVGFIPVTAGIIKVGMKIPMPDTSNGRVVAVRRHIFFFWRWQYLIQRDSSLGSFFQWYNKSKVTFCQ